MKKRKGKWVCLGLLGGVLLAILGYGLYLLLSYSRLPDNLPLEISGQAEGELAAGQPYSILTWNVGFGAYSADYSFFMDGGTESRAYSREAVYSNLNGIMEVIGRESPDFLLLQEVDQRATRSYHVDQRAFFFQQLPGYCVSYAQNYDSPYFLYPILSPHGKSQSGLMTFARFPADSALRRQLPVEESLRKFLDYDRCYSVTEYPLTDGGTLRLYHTHLSAYTADGGVKTAQLRQLLEDMAASYAAGDYVICGGDWNMDVVSEVDQSQGLSWAQPFPRELLPEGLSLVTALAEYDGTVPSCRNADAPYTPGETFTCTVDGFVVSQNVTVLEAGALAEDFTHSDHNPVKMTFVLEP